MALNVCCSVVSNSLRPHGLQQAGPPCPSPTLGVYSNSCPLVGDAIQPSHLLLSPSPPTFNLCKHQGFSQWVSSFPMSQFFTSGGQSIGASASVLPMNIQDWSPLGWTGLISLQSKGLSRVFSNTTLTLTPNPEVQKHQFFSAQLALWSNCHIHTRLL